VSGEFLDPADGYSDFMGYCRENWVSDYNYQKLFDRIVAVATSAGQALRVSGPRRTWRTLLLDDTGAATWGLPIRFRSTPEGTPEQAQVYDQSLNPIASIEVYRVDLFDNGGAQIAVPEPLSEWAAVRVAGAPMLSFAAKQTVQPYRR
jgi:hypothetical protein